jgi:serine/threonine-protein kinase
MTQSPSADPLSLTGHLLDNRYQVAEKVGEGGMAFVYLAHDNDTGDKVAIKILLPALVRDATAMERLRREAALGAKLLHPNLCHILRIGTTDHFEFIVMPFLQGELLCERTWRAGPLPLDVAAAFVRDMCAGLQLAHQHGIVHRDLKPENVMLTTGPDGVERAVVMDFGLATARDLGTDTARLTKTGLVVGTPEFMSPEHMRGKAVDARSDIYSLAFMVYELVTGQLPFDGKTLHQLMVARLKGEPIAIRARRPDLDFPEAVERVFAKALAIDPAKRYTTMLEFAQAFSRATGTTPPDTPANHRSLLGRLFRR